MHREVSGKGNLGKKRCKVAAWCINGVLLVGVSCSFSLPRATYAYEDTGVMIGEMWDLERLCDKAAQLGRYTCFVSSVPLKVKPAAEKNNEAIAE